AGTAASSSSQKFPFPVHPKPTPHQIFHLPYGVSQRDIKTRYYDLVRIYHPDSPHCRMTPPAERRKRFQAIATAYDALRGKARFEGGRTYRSSSDDPFEEELTRRSNAYWAHPSRQTGYAEHTAQQKAGNSQNEGMTMRDKIVISLGALSLLVGIVPGLIVFPTYMEKRHRDAAANLKRARSDAREYGDARMTEIRKRVQEIKS
ncbi:hypothetical protein F5887DRAFT_849671, partial [Amanita rubescens]